MRVTFVLLGWTLDWSLEPTAAESETDDGAALNGGTLASYPMGFTHWPVPEEIAAPQHCPSWDEPDE